MAKVKKTKVVNVREHKRRVPISHKNPTGITIVDQHQRHIDGFYLDNDLIEQIFNNYDKKNIIYPIKDKLQVPDENIFDEMIAVWVDYFNKKLELDNHMDPDLVKALIASESMFKQNAKNKTAWGLMQVTTATLKILQDLNGEAREFVFKGFNKSDLLNPQVAIAMGVRWLMYKQKYAEKVLNRKVTSDEIVQVYKGVLGDKSKKAQQIMKKFRGYYEKLKSY